MLLYEISAVFVNCLTNQIRGLELGGLNTCLYKPRISTCMSSYSDDVSSVCNSDHTFVVHVSWNLDDTEAEVYRQIVEMFIWLQDEFST